MYSVRFTAAGEVVSSGAAPAAGDGARRGAGALVARAFNVVGSSLLGLAQALAHAAQAKEQLSGGLAVIVVRDGELQRK